MIALGRTATLALAGAALVVLSCGTDSTPQAPGATVPFEESVSASARIGELRARFAIARADGPALGPAVATGYARGDTGGLRPLLPAAAKRGAARAASVELPAHADGESYLEDSASRVSLRFRLNDAKSSAAAVAGGYVLYANALGGADVVHRVHPEGTEDFVVFETRPAREELSYSVDVSHVPGLRLLSNTLEFLDDNGSPALRIAPPYVVDVRGVRHDAKLAVSGCVVDANAGAPWGRPMTRPGADRCTVHVTWSDVAYPAMVDPAWGSTGSMATARRFHTASMLPSGKVLVAGGDDGVAQYLSSAELYDPAAGGGVGAVVATGTMTMVRRSQSASVLASGKVLLAGGQGVVGVGGYLTSAEIFDPAGGGGAGAFVATGSMTTSRYVHSASVLASGKVLLAGGDGSGGTRVSAELFDPAAAGGVGAFVATGSMATGRQYHTATVLASGKVLVVGGVSGASIASAELFDPAAAGGVGAFVATGSMAAKRYLHSASTLASGKVLIVGGLDFSANVYHKSAELYDPATGTFGATGSMATSRASHTATVLASGKVLVAGGTNGTIFSTAEVFDPVAGTFAATASMATARSWHTANILTSGKVLVAGGTDGGAYLASTELYGGDLGDVCPGAGYCLSGFCVDGVCCDSACDAGGCDHCNVPGKMGTCTIEASGSAGANPVCGFPLACDGVSGTCPTSCASDAACAAAYYCAPNGTCQPRKAQAAACNTQANCMVAGCRECSSGNCVDGFCCDKPCGGTCEACAKALKQSGILDGTCGPIKDGTDPRDECPLMGGPCGPDGTCNGAGACRLFTLAGVSCGSGVCDHTTARGQLCDGAGNCVNSPGGVECAPYLCAGGGCTTTCVTSADCAADGWCNANKCEKRRANGKACTLKEQCSTNFCADGFCCSAQCNGQCEACDVAGAEGTCAPVNGAPHGRTPCAQGAAGQPCSATVCDGTERSACLGFAGPSVACGSASCTQGTARAVGKCDGKGACQTPETPCGAYACGPTACATSCTTDLECASGSTCDVTTSKCVSNGTCDGDHTTTGANGKTQDCAPYRCNANGSCQVTCTTVSDCVAPSVCSSSHECVPPPEDAADSGCSLMPKRRVVDSSSVLTTTALVLGLVLARRRRRRGHRPHADADPVRDGR